MKVTIYTSAATPAEMLALAEMLTALANGRKPQPQPNSDLMRAAARFDAEDKQAALDMPADASAVAIAAPDTPAPAAVFGGDQPTAEQVFTQAAASSTPAPAAATSAPPTMPTENVANASTTTASAAVVELDKDGLPWDARIHAGTRSKCADGSWKKKRGVHDAVVDQVVSELRAIMAVPGPAPTVTDAAAAFAPPPAAAAAAVTDAAAAFAPPAAAAAFAPPPAAAAVAPEGTLPPFPALMRKITAAQTAGKLNPAQITAAVQSVGLNMLPDLLKRPDLIASVEAALGDLIA